MAADLSPSFDADAARTWGFSRRAAGWCRLDVSAPHDPMDAWSMAHAVVHHRTLGPHSVEASLAAIGSQTYLAQACQRLVEDDVTTALMRALHDVGTTSEREGWAQRPRVAPIDLGIDKDAILADASPAGSVVVLAPFPGQPTDLVEDLWRRACSQALAVERPMPGGRTAVMSEDHIGEVVDRGLDALRTGWTQARLRWPVPAVAQRLFDTIVTALQRNSNADEDAKVYVTLEHGLLEVTMLAPGMTMAMVRESPSESRPWSPRRRRI